MPGYPVRSDEASFELIEDLTAPARSPHPFISTSKVRSSFKHQPAGGILILMGGGAGPDGQGWKRL